MSIVITGKDLTFAQFDAVALQRETVSVSTDAVIRMKASRAVVDKLLAAGQTAYGINTGFGKLASCKSILSVLTLVALAHLYQNPRRAP
jgi:histidine ammonia-lyase